MKVHLLTLEQKELIQDQLFDVDSYFLPIEDINGKWVITQFETTHCTTEFQWVKDLPLIEYEPILTTLI